MALLCYPDVFPINAIDAKGKYISETIPGETSEKDKIAPCCNNIKPIIHKVVLEIAQSYLFLFEISPHSDVIIFMSVWLFIRSIRRSDFVGERG